jgi:uridine monophosphate synthetase
MNFFTKLTRAIEQNQSLLCVGLDPRAENLPGGDQIVAQLVDWGSSIVEMTKDLVCCYKPNIAFFEQFGSDGLIALVEIIKRVPQEIPVLLDAKRGDIGSSADAYAKGIYQQFRADGVTLSPYLGSDSIAPFLKDQDKGAFILCHTSNPSAKEIQHHGDPPLFELIAQKVKSWGSKEQIGLVVGATQPEALRSVREICPENWILAPGVGAQGGDLAQALEAGLRPDGMGMIIPVSRSVMNAPDPRQAAFDFKEAINAYRNKTKPRLTLSNHDALIKKLFEYQCIKFGDFTLASGKQSPIYIDLRRVVSFPDLFKLTTDAYAEQIKALDFDLISGVPYAALPLSAVVAWKMGWPLIYARKEAKEHGTGQKIEGVFQPGQRVVLLEDVITSGGSILTAAETLRAEGLRVSDAVVLVDRKQGGVETLSHQGIHVHPVLDIFSMLETLKHHQLIDTSTYKLVMTYLQGN